ncbi:MAG: hypothetical protein ACKOKG_06715 [Verrucomicrobiota bacterium]
MKIAISVGAFLALLFIYIVSKRPKTPAQNDSADIMVSTEQSRLSLNGNNSFKRSETLSRFPEKWDSLVFFYRDRLDTNVFKGTNIYSIGDNLVVTNLVEYRTNKYWNTPEWEEYSRFKVEQQIKHLYPELAQVVEILQELPAVRRSNRLYSGVYSITFTMDNIRNRIESYLTYEEWGKDIEDRDWLQSERFDYQKGIQEMLEAERQVLIGLFGEMPLPVYQRIMAIESGLTYRL